MANASTTTVELDREVVRAAKVVAASEGITLKAYVERSMLAWATRWPKGTTGKNKTPALPGPRLSGHTRKRD